LKFNKNAEIQICPARSVLVRICVCVLSRFGYRANGKPKPENSVHVSMIVVAAGGWTLPPPLAEIN